VNSALPGEAREPRRRLDPKYAPVLVPAIMAIAMSLVMSLVQTIARLGFAPNLASVWLTSFAVGVAVAIRQRSSSLRALSGSWAISPGHLVGRRSQSLNLQSILEALVRGHAAGR
jgi:Protein of unknown function (DUF2798)